MRLLIRAGVLLVAVLTMASCAQAPKVPPAQAVPTVAAPPAPQKSVFQAAMDAHSVPFIAPTRGKAILVNIPSYELIALEDGEEVFRSRVIVGAPGARRETPIIDTYASVARFRPTWTPTPSMIRTGAYTPGTRAAGRGNPLGVVALRLQPGMLVYLHDTNKPHLFDRDRRALSWGCVRIENWEQAIGWALDMDPVDMRALAEGRRTVDVETTGFPVFLRYYTEFPDETGELRQYEDIYGMRPEA